MKIVVNLQLVFQGKEQRKETQSCKVTFKFSVNEILETCLGIGDWPDTISSPS